MEFIHFLVTDIFVPIIITIITITITTAHKKKVKEENFKINTYIMYEEIKEWIKFYEDCFTRNRINNIRSKYFLNFKEVMVQFNFFVENTENKLTLSEVRAILELEECIENTIQRKDLTKLEPEITNLIKTNTDELNSLVNLINSGLDKMYKFIDDNSIDRIALYDFEDLIEIRNKNISKKLKKIFEEIKKIEKNIGKPLDEHKRLEIEKDYLPNTYWEIQADKLQYRQKHMEYELENLYKDFYSYKEQLL